MVANDSIGEMETQAAGGGDRGGYTLSPGETLGQYRIIRPLGRGGMGEVYEAENLVNRKRVALKILPRGAVGGRFVERFRIESRVMMDLEHPGLVRVHHAGQERGLYYLTMDLVLGPEGEPRTLEDRLKEAGGKLPEAEVRRIALEVCAALEYAHTFRGQGVVHRDLKPANVLLGENGRPRVADFGLARVVGPEYLKTVIERSISLTLAGEVSLSDEETEGGEGKKKRPSSSARALLGTYDYMAPEQKAGGEITPRTDIYALGVMLYRMLTGYKPEGRWKQPSEFGVSRGWDKVVGKCLERDPADRFGSVKEMSAAIPAPPRGFRPGRRFLVAAAGLVILAAAVYGGWSFYSGYSASRSARRAEEARRAELSAEEQSRVAALRGEAETALARGDLRLAGEKLSELRRLGAEAPDLRRRYEAAASASEVRRRFGRASVSREEALKIDGGEGLAAKQGELEEHWIAGQRAEEAEAWGDALRDYDAVLAAARELKELDGLRREAGESRRAAEAARKEASAAEAESDAGEIWRRAEGKFQEAAELFGRGEFAAAGEGWIEAGRGYASARDRARAVDGWRKAKAAYERELSGEEESELDRHGGEEWRKAREAAREGERNADQPASGTADYERALKHLRAAAAAARQALAPRLRVVVEAGGREVRDAGLKIDGRIHKSPAELSPEPGRTVSLEVAGLEFGGKRYGESKRTIQVDWRGQTTITVALNEVRGPEAGKEWKSPATGMEFVWIEALKLWVGKYEVTNGEYRKKEPGHDSKSYQGHSLNGDRQPVVYVNFDDAKKYAEWLTKKDRETGNLPDDYRYRLPSNDEFMKYCQCGDGREYPWGSWPPRSRQAGNYADETAKRSFSVWNIISGYNDGHAVTAPVEKSWANPWGLYGVGGNVWEACASAASGGSFGAWRGASWLSGNQDGLRCSSRAGIGGANRYGFYGFRLVLSR